MIFLWNFPRVGEFVWKCLPSVKKLNKFEGEMSNLMGIPDPLPRGNHWQVHYHATANHLITPTINIKTEAKSSLKATIVPTSNNILSPLHFQT